MKVVTHRYPPFRLTHVVLAVWCALAGANVARGQEGETEPIEFRRLFVPQSRFESAPRDPGVPLRPMPKTDFERLAELLRTSPPDAKAALAARIVKAEYRCRLSEDFDLTGQAVLSIDRASLRGASPSRQLDPGALLPLSPLGLAMSSPQWPDDPPEPAMCGLDAQGQMAVLVRRSGSLLFDWTLRGTREPGGGWRYQFELPTSPNSTLSLDLPDNLLLRASRGVIVQSAPTQTGQRRWQLALGGNHQFWIQLAPQDEKRQQRLPVIRQANTYNLSSRGMELTVQLTIDVPQEPLRQLEISVDPALRLLAARHGDAQLPWSVSDQKDESVSDPKDESVSDPKDASVSDPKDESVNEAKQDAAQPTRMVLEFPEPLQGLGNVILLGATSPIILNTPWQLPGVNASDVYWQEGRATLLVPKPLAIDRMNLAECRQSAVGALPAPAAGDSVGLQYFNPSASVELVLTHGPQRLQASLGTAIELTEDAIQGRAAAELSVSEGQLFSLQAAVPHRWNIDTVESDPPGRVKDWSLDTPTPRKRVLDVRLSKALAPGANLRLVVTGHRLNVAAGESLPADELRMVDFTPGAGEHVMSVACPDAYQLQLSGGEELTRYNPQELGLAIATLFATPPEGLLFRMDPKAARLALAMQRLAPRYAADIRMTATATAGPVWESYDIQCRPHGSRVERVLVYFSQEREEAPRWRLNGENEDQLSARKLSADEMLKQCGRETGEMWELVLRRPRSTPFDIRAGRAAPLGPDTPLSLVWLPGAEEQEAQLLVRSGAEAAVQVINSRLRAVPVDAPPPGSLARARYRYSPAQDTAAADPAPLRLSRREEALSQAASVVWQASLESRYEPSGMVHHRSNWYLQNSGQSALSLQLPAGIELDDVWVDSEVVMARGTEEHLSVPLPAGRRYPTVTLHYRTREAVLGEVHQLTAPLPKADLPVLSSEWTLWLPPGYAMGVKDGAWKQTDHLPISVARRLLGPLAGAGGPRFDPFSADDWRSIAELPWLDQRALETAYSLVDQLAQQPAGAWGQTLSRLLPSLELSQRNLLIDRHALWKAGVNPATPLAAADAGAHRAGGLDRLEAAGLSLLVHDSVLLLTTPLAAANVSGQLHPLEHAALSRIRPGPLAQSLEQAVSQQGNVRYCLVNQWLTEPLSPWHAGQTLGGENVDTPGWRAYRLTGPANKPPAVEIVRQTTINVFSWGLFLLIVAVCFRRFERPDRLIIAAAGCAVLALIAPEMYAPIWSSALLALLASLAWQFVPRAMAPPPRAPASSYRYRLSDSVHTVATGVVLLALCLAAARAWADEDAADSPAPRPVVHKVLIPVDESEQPAGDLYWVPESLYTQMERRAARLALEPQDWLLERADYRGAMIWDVAQQRLQVGELRLRFDISVFEPSQLVKIPLGREGYTLTPPDKILVDGLEVPAEWQDDGQSLVFTAAQAGSYRVELSLRPTTSNFADLSGFDLSVPPLATSRLELQLPRSAPTVDIVSALGTVSLDTDTNRLVAQLGRTSKLRVRWRDGAPPSTVRTTVDADQFLWLKVQPGSIVADARWKFKVLEGSVRQVQLALDPRLQLQAPLETRNPLVAQTRVIAGNPQVVQLELTRAVSDQFTLDASLRWAGAAGIGNLRVPHVDAQPLRSLRRYMAVSLDPLLEYQETAAAGLTNMPAVDFMQLWGAADAAPALAYRVADDTSGWSLAVRPKPVLRTVDAVLAVSLSAGRSTWRYDATVETPGQCFEHRVATPATLNVESVEVREDGVPRLSHWSRDAEGLVTLFLSEPSSGPQQIVLHGWTSLPARGPWRLSSLRVEDAQQRSAQVRVYRQPSVTVEVRNRNGLTEQTDVQRQIENQLFESDRRYLGLGRLAAVLKADAPAYSATLLVSPNLAKFDCQQVTTLKREAGAWQAELDCQVKVSAGLLDTLRFEIPSTWQAPFVVTPAADYDVTDTGNGRQLSVRPVAAISGESRLRIRGNLVSPTATRLQLPAISIVGAQRVERLLVAPGQIDLQAVSWETRGLSRVDPPADFDGGPGLAMPEAYLVVDDAFAATLQPAARSPGEPRVTLADISLSWQTDGEVQGVASFDLDPAGNQECPLVLPEGYQLVQVLVNNLPGMAHASGLRQWRLALASEELPQRIEVIFTGTLPSAQWGRQQLSAPMLGDLPVERTLWTLRTQRGTRWAEALQTHAIGGLRQELTRLQATAELMATVDDAAHSETSADLAAWYELWSRRYQQCRTAVGREAMLAREAETASSAAAEVRQLDDAQARLAQELFGKPQAAPDTPLEQPRQLWQFAFETPQLPLRAAFDARMPQIEVQSRSTTATEGRWRLLAALAAVALAAGVLALLRSRWWPALHRWRHLAAVLFGLAWWLWLSPGIVGCLIVLLAGVDAWRNRADHRESGSAIVRLGTGVN